MQRFTSFIDKQIGVVQRQTKLPLELEPLRRYKPDQNSKLSTFTVCANYSVDKTIITLNC